ncbi:MAG: hypothetical protein V1775_03205 [Bacteroidota bacterium]
MFQKRPGTFYIFLAFVALTIIAYWQVAFLQNGFKWDMLGCYLPWRYHAGECLQNGIFPLWNPYTHCGYPIHADLRSVWYPEVFIIGLTSGYSYLTIHLLFIIYVSLAGLGMYLLSRHFTGEWKAGFIAGTAYLMSGFLVGHGQEMFGIIAATWIPYVLYYFILLQKERKYVDVVRTALFSFLLVTGGYQAMWAILFYLLLVLFIAYFFRYFNSGNRRAAWRLAKLNGVLVLVTGISLMVIAVSFIQVSSHVGRLGGISVEDACFMPFSPRSAISFLLPFATVKDVGWYDTDISMNNAYTGLVILIFFVLALFSKRKLLLNVFLVFGLVALLASFGKYTPVRGILYHYVPLFNLFRHSSFFVYFAVIAIIPAAASGLEFFLSDPVFYMKKLIIITCISAVVILVLMTSSLVAMSHGDFSFLKPAGDFADWIRQPSRHEHIVIQSIIQLAVILIFLFLIVRKSGPRYRHLAVMIVFEMMASVQLNTYYTVVSAGIDPCKINHILKQRPDGFPLPVPGIPVSSNTEKNASASVIWQNTNIFNKTVSFEGYNSFRLNGYDSLADSLADLAGSVIKNEVIYLSDQVIPFNRRSQISTNDLQQVLFVENRDFQDIFLNLRLSSGDSVRITGFHPGFAEAEVICQEKVAVTLLQAWYPGWEVSIDGKESQAFVSNKMFISTICSPGKHRVTFKYNNRTVIAGFLVSYLVVLILLSILIYNKFRYKGLIISIIWIAAMWVVVAVLTFVRFNPAWSGEEKKEGEYQSAARTIVGSGIEQVICNTDNGVLMARALRNAGYTGNCYLQNLTYQRGISDLIACIDSLKTDKVALVSLFAPLPDVAIASFRNKWPLLIMRDEMFTGSIMVFSECRDITGFSSFCDFEKPVMGWNGSETALDSLHSWSGRFSDRVDSINNGSFSFKWRPHSRQKHKPFGVFVRAKVTGDFTGASLFIQQIRDGKPVRSSTVSNGTWQVTTEKWSDIAGYGYFPEGAIEGDEVSVFFWGNSHSVCYIDDFQVSVNFIDE